MEQERAPVKIETFTNNSAARNLGMWVGIVAGAAVLGIVGYAVWTVKQYLPLLGETIIISLGIAITGCVLWGIIALLKYATAVQWHDIGEFGSRERGLFSRQVYAPMSANTPKLTQRKNKVVVTPVVPSIIELINQGVIAVGQLMMHMGFEVSKTGLIPVIDRWPGTFIVAGAGRSGKTRRVLTIVVQAIMGKARIFICDPHRTKPDGLAKMLQPLAPWLTIARGYDECIALTNQFIAEMKRRVATGEDLIPWIIIFDEFSYLMSSNDFSDEDKAIIVECVADCSTRYAGYNGFAGIIGQVWTNEACPTVIRRSAHKVFAHQLNHEYASFFFKGKYATKVGELEPRQCLYRQGAETKQIVTIDVPDTATEWIANYLMEYLPPDEIPQVTTHTIDLLPGASNLKLLNQGRETFHETETSAETIESETPETAKHFDMNKLETLRRLRSEGTHNQSSIIQQIWNVKPGGTTAYQNALAEYKQLLEIIVRGA